MHKLIVVSSVLFCFGLLSSADAKSAPQTSQSTSPSLAQPGDQAAMVQPVLNGAAFKQALLYKRREIFESAFQLMQPDKDKFWNIYADYEADKGKLDETRIKMLEDYVKNFTTITAEQMNQSIDMWYDNQ